MIHKTFFLTFASCLLACADPCRVDIEGEECPASTTVATSTADTTGPDMCLPVEPGHPYGPCPHPDGGCLDFSNVCVDGFNGAGSVCARTCIDDSTCAEVPYCTPDDADARCIFGWCVVPCPCPGGMVCDDSQLGGTGVCVWPNP